MLAWPDGHFSSHKQRALNVHPKGFIMIADKLSTHWLPNKCHRMASNCTSLKALLSQLSKVQQVVRSHLP